MGFTKEIEFLKDEERVLRFWKRNNIFEKSLKKNQKGKKFVFFEGPPTANGRPGIHHVLSRVFKDIICRYKTMQGFKVERKSGWDTHGLPVELEVEKKLGLKSKKDIEKYGIGKFNKKCKKSVWQYKEEFENLTERIGFWLDLKNPYITYNNNYIESVWWILKEIYKKGLLYQDYRVSPYCPRCQTVLSSHEVAQGYKRVKEPAIYVKIKVLNPEHKNCFLLVWTTTPWTLPANVAVAVNPEFDYAFLEKNGEILILAKERINVLNIEGKILKEIKGKDLIGLKYQPVFDFYEPSLERERIWEVVPADFVSLKEGTGLVHIAPAFGEEDMEVIKSQNSNLKSQNYNREFPIILNVNEEGKFKLEVKKLTGLFVKDADSLIIQDLKERGVLFKEEIYEHDYPFCWRCKTPLLYYAKKSWFIKMTNIKEELIKSNQKINWVPDHLKNGRFGEWLEEVKDWAISRERYWGTPLPIWKCEKCKEEICIGSIKEMQQKSKIKNKIKDLHRPFIDKIILKCEKCNGKMKRVLDVIDCWFDSGSMPFAQYHYPFENKNLIENKEQFPADYICEGIDQTRGWFYTLLAISVLIDKGAPYKNVVVVGHVLDEKGEKMSKSKGNVVDPWKMIEKYGADSIRWYFYTINQSSEPKLFNEKDIENVLKRFGMVLWNCFTFFKLYEGNLKTKTKKSKTQVNRMSLLDKWIISRLNNLILSTENLLDNYNITPAARLIEEFVINDLSRWYIRRSRKNFHPQTPPKEKERAIACLYYILLSLTKLIAAFMPFLAEDIYQKLRVKGMPTSIHLSDWPKANKRLIDSQLEEKMSEARNIVNLALAERSLAKIKVRQPIALLRIKKENSKIKNEKELLELIKEEVNVKEIIFSPHIEKEVEIDTNITLELKEEGIIREVIRHIQEMRKEMGLKPKDKILIKGGGLKEINEVINKNKDLIKKETLSKDFLILENLENVKLKLFKEIKVDDKILKIKIEKIR